MIQESRYNNSISNITSFKRASFGINELEKKRTDLENELSSFIESLPEDDRLSVKEDVDFYMSQIQTRKNKKAENEEIKKEIISQYPNALNLDLGNAMSYYPFTAIDSYINPEEEIQTTIEEKAERKEVLKKKETPVVKTDTKKVKRTFAAPEKLLQSLKIEEVKEDKKEEKQSSVTQSDVSFFEENDLLKKKITQNDDEKPVLVDTKKDALNIIDEKPTLKEDETTSLNVSDEDIKDNQDDSDNKSNEEVKPIEVKEEEIAPVAISDNNELITPLPVKDEKEPEIEDQKEDNIVKFPVSEEVNEVEPIEDDTKYTMEHGDTLANLALALCDDENGWYDIYKVNKEVLDKAMADKDIKDFNDIEHNEEVFNGLALNIPNIFKKEKPEDLEESKSLAA
jgi:hypothetical protein